MTRGFIRWLPAAGIFVLFIVHWLLWRWLTANEAAASLFSSGPKNSVAIFSGMLVFMASRLILYLVVPGCLAALLAGKLMLWLPGGAATTETP